jgi:catechol-2,3-dioxygenase
MTKNIITPQLTFSHVTRAVRDMDRMVSFYRDVLGFLVNDRGFIEETELTFMSQIPTEHHQFVLVSGIEQRASVSLLADHIAFRTATLDDLRTIKENLIDAGIDDMMVICHGNAWSIYCRDIEGNGLECFVDTPFHMAQPVAAVGFDLDLSDEEIIKWTHELCESGDDFQPMNQWRESFIQRLKQSK